MSTIQYVGEWLPPVDFSKAFLSDECSNAPKEFLETEAWKLLLRAPIAIERRSETRCVVTIPYRWPVDKLQTGSGGGMPDPRLATFAKMVVRLHVENQEDRLFSFLADEGVSRIDYVLQEQGNLESMPELDREVAGRTLNEWACLYVRGQAFAIRIRNPWQSRYVFIEELFGAPRWFDDARTELFGNPHRKHLIITGPPRAGKTYAGLRLLYEAFVRDDTSGQVAMYDSAAELRADLKEQAEADLRKFGPLYILLDDPFGTAHTDLAATRDTLTIVNEIVQKDLPVRLIFTTRTEVFEAAHRMLRGDFSDHFKEFAIRFSSGENVKNAYPIKTLQNIFEKTAWVQKAKWLPRYKSYRETSRGSVPDGMSLEWDRLVTHNTSPGVMVSGMILYPQLLEYKGDQPSDINMLGTGLARAQDLQAAFSSEVETWIEHEQAPEELLFVLLPAISVVTEDVLGTIFDRTELNSCTVLRRFFEEKWSGGAYEIKSLQYFNDAFAEAVSDYLNHNGRELFERYLAPFLANRAGQVKPSLLADFLCDYYSLGCGDTTNADAKKAEGTLLQVLESSTGEFQWVKLLNAFLNDSPKEVEDSAKILAAAEVANVSRFSSFVDQCLSAPSESSPTARVTDLLEALFGILFDPESKDTQRVLKASLALHGILSHIEDQFFNEEKASDSNLDMFWRSITGVEQLSILASKPAGPRVWFEASVVWIDAFLMKIGELQYFLAGRQEDSLHAQFQQLIGWMQGKVKELWEAVNLAGQSQERRKWLAGAMGFSVAWHNRWGVSSRTLTSVIEWVEKESFLENFDASYWEGARFNMTYHAAYFEAKAAAWRRESAIFLWRRNRPRLGADSYYESGLPPGEETRKDDLATKFSSFFTECMNYFFPLSGMAPKIESSDLQRISFILGMRAARSPELAGGYCERTIQCLRSSELPWRLFFLHGVDRLREYSLGRSLDIVERALTANQMDIQDLEKQLATDRP